MSEWKNIGDIDLRSGALLIRGGAVDRNGDFSVDIVDVTPKSNVGGDDQRFLIRSGTGFLGAKNFASALEMIGASIDPESLAITVPDHNGDDEVRQEGTEEWVRTMADATYAYGGIDDVDISTLVQIGKDGPHFQERKFDGDLHVYYEGSSLSAIMRKELDAFDFEDGKKGGARFLETVKAAETPSPWY